MVGRYGPVAALLALLACAASWAAATAAGETAAAPRGAAMADAVGLFAASDRCMACHNGMRSASGQELAIGRDWRASMMANAARDPYWHAAVRREALDHPTAVAAIENECAACHMPMARTEARAAGRLGEVFVHLPPGAPGALPASVLAADGVSCTLCHQIQPEGLGSDESFTAGFVIDTSAGPGQRQVLGPYAVDPGLASVMSSATGFRPAEGAHLRGSEHCGTCHTLFTHALGPDGEPLGRLPEQVPYLEWRHSAYRETNTCQSCHMVPLDEDMPIASVLGAPRPGVAPHVFRGGNFFMLRMLQRHAGELGVTAREGELEAVARRTLEHLQQRAARVTIERAELAGGVLEAAVRVENLAGHKLPTAYPSRRAWIHLTVRDGGGRTLFESGALAANGSIAGNDNDADPGRFEPHHQTIEDAGQVQVYEPILGDARGAVTTGLLTAVRYLKDNRLLPRGFDKVAAGDDVAVRGAALGDQDFRDGGDLVRYVVAVGGAPGPITVEAELWYQPIAYRWAENLAAYDSAESRRFASYYRGMADASGIVLARGAVRVERRTDPASDHR
jgi:hypothetical protein